MFRRVLAPGLRTLFTTTPSTLQSILTKGDGTLPALHVPDRNIIWSRSELALKCFTFAAALRDLGYADQPKPLALRLNNSPELCVALLGAALAGVDVRTSKSRDGFSAITSHGSVVHVGDMQLAGDMLGSHEPIVVGDGAGMNDPAVLWDVLMHVYQGAAETEMAPNAANAPSSSFFFSTDSKPNTLATLLNSAEAARSALELQPCERVCIPVPLTHNMGLGFGLLSVLSSEACVVLPGECNGGSYDATLHDRANSAIEAVEKFECVGVVGDTHVVNEMRGFKERMKRIEELGVFRTGLLKVGGGVALGAGDRVQFAGGELVTVGLPKLRS
ncbi:hypothetical protein CYMTET_4798 [Cymbomonas tetramitiformis]|uniref:Uncharacterized protein n=1 Tax=Cymbomonas tetramitiformis TaxID=36881 RepID=A0AAE0LJJ3_9CHLO|nr:hypothetical protein CYMTET_4798 [Cymbomonas tetramitiformis]